MFGFSPLNFRAKAQKKSDLKLSLNFSPPHVRVLELKSESALNLLEF